MAKVLVEYVRLDRAGEREREASVLLDLVGQSETLSEIADTPVLTAGAPAWGKDQGLIVPQGYGRITVLVGAVLCRWGGAAPNPAGGARISAGAGPLLVQLKAGDRIAFVRAEVIQELGTARADLQTVGNQALEALSVAAAGAGLRILPPTSRPAAAAPVAGVFAASGLSAPFAAEPGRPINLVLGAGEAPWSASVRLLRKLPGDDLYRPLTLLGQPWGVFTGPVSEPIWEESEVGALFRLECEHDEGAAPYRISQ